CSAGVTIGSSVRQWRPLRQNGLTPRKGAGSTEAGGKDRAAAWQPLGGVTLAPSYPPPGAGISRETPHSWSLFPSDWSGTLAASRRRAEPGKGGRNAPGWSSAAQPLSKGQPTLRCAGVNRPCASAGSAGACQPAQVEDGPLLLVLTGGRGGRQ